VVDGDIRFVTSMNKGPVTVVEEEDELTYSMLHYNEISAGVVITLCNLIPTAVAAHSPAYLYGFGLGKNAGLRVYYGVMNDCSKRPYLSTKA